MRKTLYKKVKEIMGDSKAQENLVTEIYHPKQAQYRAFVKVGLYLDKVKLWPASKREILRKAEAEVKENDKKIQKAIFDGMMGALDNLKKQGESK